MVIAAAFAVGGVAEPVLRLAVRAEDDVDLPAVSK